MWQKTPEELRQVLAAPFANGDIEWRVSVTTRDKDRGLAVPYVTNRAIQNRLDDTVGIDGWQNQFVPWKEGKAQLCGISIYFGQQKLWLTKWDGADDSDFESVKGGLSDSMKRAAVEWGIGRYLYGMTQIWVRIEQHGKSYIIVDDERSRLDEAHENWVSRRQGKNPSQSQGGGQSQPQGNGQSQGQRRDAPPQGRQQNSQQGQRQQNSSRRQQPVQRQQPQEQQQSGPFQSVQQQPFQQNTQGQRPPSLPPAAPPPAETGLKEGFYLVTGAVLKPTLNGGARTSVQLQNCAGQYLQAYTQGPDSRLAPGVKLYNVKINSRGNNGVTFYTLDAYDIVTYTAQDAA